MNEANNFIHPHQKFIIQKIEEILKNNDEEEQNILDIGCSTGALMKELKKN